MKVICTTITAMIQVEDKSDEAEQTALRLLTEYAQGLMRDMNPESPIVLDDELEFTLYEIDDTPAEGEEKNDQNCM